MRSKASCSLIILVGQEHLHGLGSDVSLSYLALLGTVKNPTSSCSLLREGGQFVARWYEMFVHASVRVDHAPGQVGRLELAILAVKRNQLSNSLRKYLESCRICSSVNMPPFSTASDMIKRPYIVYLNIMRREWPRTSTAVYCSGLQKSFLLVENNCPYWDQ